MGHKDDLEQRINKSYVLVQKCEAVIQTSDRPKEIERSQADIDQQWELIEGYLVEYIRICQELNLSMPEDILQIAAHFPKLLAQILKRAHNVLHRMSPESGRPLNQLVWVLREFGRFHKHLNEWKELHNLLQECMLALTPLKDELVSVIEQPGRWEMMRGRRLWRLCRAQLSRLESFACDIKHTDDPFYRSTGGMRGPSWMIEITGRQEELEIRLQESNVEMIYDSTLSLWDTFYAALHKADKQLRNVTGELYLLSNTILRSLENDEHSQ